MGELIAVDRVGGLLRGCCVNYVNEMTISEHGNIIIWDCRMAEARNLFQR